MSDMGIGGSYYERGRVSSFYKEKTETRYPTLPRMLMLQPFQFQFRDRAAEVGGRLQLQEAQPHGTRVIARLPGRALPAQEIRS